MEQTDKRWLRRALSLARRGIGTAHPNPHVGAVVVADGEIVGEGWHEGPGLPHAEVVALQKAADRARGATLYVTLEPCAAHGRTPPCTEAIIAAGIARVVYASSDPNPEMAGGADVLRTHGIEMQSGLMSQKADKLNRPFFHFLRTDRPYVVAKAAVSLDGKLATQSGQSQWISGEQSRRHAHRLRAESDVIIVGAGTLRRDNPSLDVRHARRRGQLPLRAVICSEAPEFKPDYKLADGTAPSRLYVKKPTKQGVVWQQAGVEVVQADTLDDVLRHLASEGRLAVLLEGGGRLHASFFEAGLADELVLYQPPILIGGEQAPGLWHGLGIKQLSKAPHLTDIERRMLGNDQLIRGRIVYPD